jgi:hypothetical protein
MDNGAVRFTERQMELMARYIAELTKNNVVYRVDDMIDGWTVTVIGY